MATLDSVIGIAPEHPYTNLATKNPYLKSERSVKQNHRPPANEVDRQYIQPTVHAKVYTNLRTMYIMYILLDLVAEPSHTATTVLRLTWLCGAS